MRTNVDSLAVDYALEEQPLEADNNFKTYALTNEELRYKSKDDFKAGFNKCYNLVKPLLDKAIEDFKDEYGDNEDYKYTYEKIQEFLEKYEQ